MMMNNNTICSCDNARHTPSKLTMDTTSKVTDATPVKIATIPRLTKKRSATPFRCPLQTPDRFIPNRSRMDMSRIQASMRKGSNAETTSLNKTKGHHRKQINYERQLCQALWGTNENDTRMMAFGPNSGASKRFCATPKCLFPDHDDPYSQDILRPTSLSPYNATHGYRPQRQVSMDFVKALQAPDLFQDEDLTLVGSGKYFAIALDNTIYLSKEDGTIDVLVQNTDGTPFSCVQWSNDRKLLAVGSSEVQVFEPEKSKVCVALLCEHEGYVTAIAWNGLELIAACESGMTRYDLRSKDVVQAVYQGHGSDRVTDLQWKDGTIASAGGGKIKIWDSNIRGKNIAPRHAMAHSGVKTLQFCQQSMMLVSGGDHGLMFWNTWNGDVISVWTLQPAVEMIYERKTHAETILSMVESVDGDIFCAHDNETVSVYSIRRSNSKGRAPCTETSLLSMPILR